MEDLLRTSLRTLHVVLSAQRMSTQGQSTLEALSLLQTCVTPAMGEDELRAITAQSVELSRTLYESVVPAVLDVAQSARAECERFDDEHAPGLVAALDAKLGALCESARHGARALRSEVVSEAISRKRRRKTEAWAKTGKVALGTRTALKHTHILHTLTLGVHTLSRRRGPRQAALILTPLPRSPSPSAPHPHAHGSERQRRGQGTPPRQMPRWARRPSTLRPPQPLPTVTLPLHTLIPSHPHPHTLTPSHPHPHPPLA